MRPLIFFNSIWLVGLHKKIVILILLALFLMSCSNSYLSNKVISIKFTASKDVNPDINGRSSPIALTVYHLTNSSLFRKSDYLSLTENSTNLLGNDLLSTKLLILHPGQEQTVEYLINESPAAFGVVAGYRVIDKSGWQLAYDYQAKQLGFWSPLKGKDVFEYKIYVDKNQIYFYTSLKEQQ